MVGQGWLILTLAVYSACRLMPVLKTQLEVLGGVLFNEHGEMSSFFSAAVSKAQANRLNPLVKETIIFELEVRAALLGGTLLLQAAAVCANDRVVLFLDSDAVLGRVISGKSGLGLDGQII